MTATAFVPLIPPSVHPMHRDKITPIARSLPFVYSCSGWYVHRVRSAMIVDNGLRHPPHAAYRCWCGMTLLHGKRKQSLLSATPAGRPVCATCEGRYIGAGHAGERRINERDVMFAPMGVGRD